MVNFADHAKMSPSRPHLSVDTKEILWMLDDWLNAGIDCGDGDYTGDVITEVRNLVAMLNNELLLREWDEGHDGR